MFICTFIDNCIAGITANKERCRNLLDNSVGIATALCPYIGYKKSADITKKALQTGQQIKNIVLEEGILDSEQLEQILNPIFMTQVNKSLIRNKDSKNSMCAM